MNCPSDNMEQDFAEQRILDEMNRIRPRVHCLTNPVTMQDVANILLAAGGSAIMAQDPREVAEITAICQALLLNTGVPDEEKMRACRISGKKANELGIPVVLDPVGAGASSFRLRELEQLTNTVKMTLIRCNQEEAKALLHIWNGVSGGVESGVAETADQQTELAEKLAEVYQCAVLVSGERDVAAEGGRTAVLIGGDARLSRITGGGCMVSALCALLCGAGAEPLEAARTAGRLWRACAEWAAAGTCESGGGIGTFHMRLFDGAEHYFYRTPV